MKNLVSMVEFVLEVTTNHAIEKTGVSYTLAIINKYAQFLSQKLELWMFIPCKLIDGVWVVLEETRRENYPNEIYYLTDLQEYQEAKERCLFEGFEFVKQLNDIDNGSYYRLKYRGHFRNISFTNSIEYLVDFDKEKIKLTDSAQKQIGL